MDFEDVFHRYPRRSYVTRVESILMINSYSGKFAYRLDPSFPPIFLSLPDGEEKIGDAVFDTLEASRYILNEKKLLDFLNPEKAREDEISNDEMLKRATGLNTRQLKLKKRLCLVEKVGSIVEITPRKKLTGEEVLDYSRQIRFAEMPTSFELARGILELIGR